MLKRLILACALAVMGGVAYQSSAAHAANGALNPSGNCTVDTTALTMTCPGATYTGVLTNGIAVFEFSSITIGAGVTITATGGNPLELLSDSTATINGTVDASGQSVTQNFTGAPGEPGGPGGGAGGSGGSPQGCVSPPGEGPGGGGGANCRAGAGGGGFGGAGAAGASDSGYTGGAGGPAYGNLAMQLQGGSGGGGADETPGGGGGGGVEIAAATGLTVGGSVLANGGDGGVGSTGASGGGSGGGIILDAPTVTVSGTVSANGGQGGAGGCCGDAGGGGGGRILIESNSHTVTGTLSVAGGTSGTAGGYPHGSLSPQAAGGDGVISYGPYVSVTGSSGVTACKGTVCPQVLVNGSQSGKTIYFKAVEGTNGGIAGTLRYTDTANAAATIPGCTTPGAGGTTSCVLNLTSLTCSGTTASSSGTWTYGGVTHQVQLTMSGTSTTVGTVMLTETLSGGATYSATISGRGLVNIVCPA